jgi:outer membrane protein assembly factor BamB
MCSRAFHRLSALAALIAGLCACTGNQGTLPPPQDIQPEGICVGSACFDGLNTEEDTGEGQLCQVLWTTTLGTAGGTAHLALGKGDVIYAASAQNLYAIEKTGNQLWAWPQDDDQSGIASPGELYTPVIGSEGTLYMGTNAESLLAVGKNGIARFLQPLDGNLSGAVAVAQDGYVMAVTDKGAVYHIEDRGTLGTFMSWKMDAEEKLPDFLVGIQPVIGPAEFFGQETLLIPTRTALRAMAVEDGKKLWSRPLPDGFEITSNLMLDEDANVLFVAGREKNVEYYKESRLFQVDPNGELVVPEGFPVWDNYTRVVSLSQGIQGTVLLGTVNAGLFSMTAATGLANWRYVPKEQNVEQIAQPLQTEDGFVFFSAGRHWVYVVSAVGERVWHQKLEVPEELIGALLWPSSPVALGEGRVVYKNSNQIKAVQCLTSGPASLHWPRFGGNDYNSGNITDKLVPPPTE